MSEFQLPPVSDRIERLRKIYREGTRWVCVERFKLITQFYQEHPEERGILKRARMMRYICENIPLAIHPDELIIGGQSPIQGASAIYPEVSVRWLIEEMEDDHFRNREGDPYEITDENVRVIKELAPFWLNICQSAVTDAVIPPGFKEVAQEFQCHGWAGMPAGHFVVPHRTLLARGFAEIREDAINRMKKLEAEGTIGPNVEKYYTWYGFAIAMEAGQIIAHRYSELAAKMAAECTDPKRKAELELISENMEVISTDRPHTFYQAVQCMHLYMQLVFMDAQMHGTSYGRLDVLLAPYYERDIKAGILTPEQAQEYIDAFALKAAETNRFTDEGMARTAPGYTSGQLITLGGVDADGKDATSDVTYMFLAANARLKLHDPTQAVRIHPDTPDKLWEYVIECNKINGGVPSIQNDQAIIPCLTSEAMGFSLADARDYALVGCMEPGGNGNDWPQCGVWAGTGSMISLPGSLLLAMFNGHDILHAHTLDEVEEQLLMGPETGWFVDMESMDELLEGVKAQVAHYVRWHANCVSAYEYSSRDNLPVPLASAPMEGCMESGRDATWGGARYNSAGITGIGVGNLVDSLQMIDHLVFKEQVCTKEELCDALVKNWEGYEELHSYILNKAPHYGNGDPEADRFLPWFTEYFGTIPTKYYSTRGGHLKSGLWSVTGHVGLGYMTAATPDGRFAGTPVAESTAPPQGVDKNGPLAFVLSVSNYNQSLFGNGTALNMKFHPATVNTPEANLKLRHLIETYFDRKGMQLQFNIAGADTMIEAQEHPEEFQDLVVRIAGFSAYFVEMTKESQDELIQRTVHEL